ncbi:MAG: hypothetical protein KIT09_35560 [Bryobacteraceae bacterium]|nr:hypothetical protein [Bryobacteraceae bacterium]
MPRALSLLFAGWLAVSASVPAVPLSGGQRVRMSRCPRLDLDPNSDLSHEGESHSLDIHYQHHRLLASLSGGAVAVTLPAREPAAAVADFVHLLEPEIAFTSFVPAWSGDAPILRSKGVAQGRAPPLHS